MTKIKMSVKRGTAVAKSDWQKTATNYSVKLSFEGRTMTAQWWAGSLAGIPSLTDVISTLCLDSSSVDGVDSFEEWAENIGYDTDSREAERIYKATVSQAKRFKKFIGQDYYSILWMDENEIADWLKI